MPSPKIIIAAGGTGGHLIPAQVLASQLQERGADIRFAGAGLAQSPYFNQRQYAYVDIPSSTIALRHPFRSLKGTVALGCGLLKAYRALSVDRPQLVVGFGSFHSFPVLAAARFMKVPIVLHDANAIAGKVVRLFSNWAKVTGIAIPSARHRLHGQVELIPTPLRPSYGQRSVSAEAAREYFGLLPNEPTLLVFGGSQGAHHLNCVVSQALHRFPNWQVIHLTGRQDFVEVRDCYLSRGQRCYVAPYEEEMVMAWAAADLTVMRAGASSVAELLAMQVPSILVPYPYAADDHQTANAKWIQEMGGGIYLRESECSVDRLCKHLDACTDQRLEQMRACLVEYRKQSKRELVDCVWELATQMHSTS